jgi:Spy/CpxP family protein refolding chaperone
MKRWKSILGVLLVFLLGALAGAAVLHRIDRQNTEAVLSGRDGATVDLVVRRLSRSLDLDPTQRDQVRAIVSETHRDIDEIRKPIRAQVMASIENSRARVRAILRPDQQEKFDRLQAERRKRRGWPESSRP